MITDFNFKNLNDLYKLRLAILRGCNFNAKKALMAWVFVFGEELVKIPLTS